MSDQGSADRAQTWLIDLVHERRVSPAQRRVIQYMLASLPDVAFASTIDVAEAAGVSQPTVTRLATALGYAGYPEFRSAIRDVVLSQATGSDVAAGRDTFSTALNSVQQNVAALQRTLEGEPMRLAVERLSETRPLCVIGLRASSALASYLGYFAGRVLPDVRVLGDAASMDDAILQARLDGATAVLAFVMPRYPDATVRALSFARKLGMATVAITDSPLVPFGGEVDVLLVAPSATDLVFDTHASAVVLSMALLDALASQDPHRTQERLEAHEELVERWVYPDR